MFFPIGDDNSDVRITPYVNYLFLGLNIIVFLVLQGMGSNEVFNNTYSLIPAEISSGADLIGPQLISAPNGEVIQIQHFQTPFNVNMNFLSSMFMHGDFMHLFGNMLFLWVFGDNLEDRLGHVRFIGFYILCGVGAGVAQIVMDTESVVPMLGASGAISGLLGAYIALFPKRQVRTVILGRIANVPAIVVLGIWFGMQVVFGLLSPEGVGGVAYAAHIGGFIVGLVLIGVFALGTDRSGKANPFYQ
jgi:membrane associated rhomboid family serine protease